MIKLDAAKAVVVGKAVLIAVITGGVGIAAYYGYKWVQAKMPEWKEKWKNFVSKIKDPFGLFRKKAVQPKSVITDAGQIATVRPAVTDTAIKTVITQGMQTASNLGTALINQGGNVATQLIAANPYPKAIETVASAAGKFFEPKNISNVIASSQYAQGLAGISSALQSDKSLKEKAATIGKSMLKLAMPTSIFSGLSAISGLRKPNPNKSGQGVIIR